LALTPGTRLGVYEIVELIGAGGMGESPSRSVMRSARRTRAGSSIAI
jgi:hypothetical protein